MTITLIASHIDRTYSTDARETLNPATSRTT